MRIDAYNQIQQVYATGQIKKNDDTKGKSKTSFMDELRLSSMGIDATLAKNAVETAPDVREEKVAAIKEQIDNGTYEVDMDDFAGKLLERYSGLF